MADKNVQQFLGNVKIDGAAEVNTIELATSDTGDGTKGLVSPRADNPTKFDSLSIYNGSLYLTENKSSPTASDGQRKLIYSGEEKLYFTTFVIRSTILEWQISVCLVSTKKPPGNGLPSLTLKSFIDYLNSPNVSIASVSGLWLSDNEQSTIYGLGAIDSETLRLNGATPINGTLSARLFYAEQGQCSVSILFSQTIMLA